LLDPYHQFHPSLTPPLYKKYIGREGISLSLDSASSGAQALDAIAAQPSSAEIAKTPDLLTLTRLLYFSAGITKSITYSSYGEMLFRAAACTGALYHIELYLVCGDLPALAAGVYHFDPLRLALVPLREGDYRSELVEASGIQEDLQHAPASLIYTDVFWRNAVKYQAREYRHAFWDSGTILANSLAVAAAYHLPAKVITGFDDERVNRLLDLDAQREAALFLLSLGFTPDRAPASSPAVTPLNLEIEPVSGNEKVFPAILNMHEASSLSGNRQVADWRARAESAGNRTAPPGSPQDQGQAVPLQPLSTAGLPDAPLEKVILRRGSSRRFTGGSISFPELSTILEASTRGIPADFYGPQPSFLNRVYLIANAVDGLPAGSYWYDPDRKALTVLQQGDFRGEAGALALGQELAADASANIYFMIDLEVVLDRFGNRGYRIAQLEASVMAGKIYLAAYALKRGATGLTFYDNTVTQFFSPHAAGKQVMFLIALGVPARRRRF
jgi:SagB-type dehydrogenase family enzyme